MAVETNLSNNIISLGGNFDNIVIVDNFQSKRGGASLDVTEYTPSTIYAGHVIIRTADTSNPGNYIYKPMPVTGEPFASGSAYGALPADHEYYGIQIQTMPTNRAMVGILLRGTVNPSDSCNPYPLGPILTALQTAVTDRIDFRGDGE